MSPRSDERMIAIALREPDEGALEGIFQGALQDAGRGAVVAPPHPLYGGSMDSPVASELSWACVRAGISPVRFNWRGVGASTGAPSGDAGCADRDFAAALAYVAETVPGKVVAAGYSFGALAALRASAIHPRIDRLVMVSPPLQAISEGAVCFERPTLVVSGDRDELVSLASLEAVTRAHPQVALRAIEGADHFFAAGLGELGRHVHEWLDEGAP
jgi:alpha/beta superfamily hydrolase